MCCLVTFSCKKIESYDDKPVAYHGTRVIAHKGGPVWPFGSFTGNTLDACVYGFEHADGVEVDVQMSRNGTLWLYHDEFFSACDVNGKGHIPAYTDEEIGEHIACMGNGYTLNTLEDVFAHHRFHGLTDFVVLDVKSWLPTQYSNTPGFWLTLAEEIVRLAHVYNMEPYVQVECENALMLNRVKKLSSLETFLATNCDLQSGIRKALKEGYTGISHRADCNILNADDVKLMHRKGMRVQLWVVNDAADKLIAEQNEVDFIQSDNP